MRLVVFRVGLTIPARREMNSRGHASVAGSVRKAAGHRKVLIFVPDAYPLNGPLRWDELVIVSAHRVTSNHTKVLWEGVKIWLSFETRVGWIPVLSRQMSAQVKSFEWGRHSLVVDIGATS